MDAKTDKPEGPRTADWDNGLLHDLRSPLCALLGYLHLIERQAGVQASQKTLEFVANAREAATRMGEIMEHFLDGSNRNALPFPIEPSGINLQELFIRLRNTFALSAAQKGLVLEFDTATPYAWGDRQLILRVLENLLSNAIKFTPAGGRVRVAVQPQPGRCLFKVSDTGRGIPMEHLETIFERGHQVTLEDRTHGYGLGLLVVKQVVEAHQGQIWVDSEVGVGTSFYFWLPGQAGHDGQHLEMNPAIRGQRLLTID